MSAVSPFCIKSGHEGAKGGRIDYRAQEEEWNRVDKGGVRAVWVSGWSLKYPTPMTAYLVLDIQTGPCLDQQICDVAVTNLRGQHERSAANLYHEWT